MLSLYRRLESILEIYSFSDELQRELEEIQEGLFDTSFHIRETCYELRPSFLLGNSLVESLELLVEQVQLRSNYRVEFRKPFYEYELSDELKVAVYRIVQELLSNATKHSHTSVVQIELEQRELLYFRYKDDGMGMDLIRMKDTFQHMGISGIKERVHSLNGDLEI